MHGGDDENPRVIARQTDAIDLCTASMLVYGDAHPALAHRGCMALSVLVGRDTALRQQVLAKGVREEWLLVL